MVGHVRASSVRTIMNYSDVKMYFIIFPEKSLFFGNRIGRECPNCIFIGIKIVNLWR